MTVASKNNPSAVYPEPPVIISTLETPPPDTTTLAVAPFHVPDAEPLNSLTFWNVPFVYVAPPVIVPVLIPLNPCSRLNPMVAIPADESTVEIDRPTPKTLRTQNHQ